LHPGDTGIFWDLSCFYAEFVAEMNNKLNSAQQVADLIGIKVDTLYRYARSGQIRGMKIGKSWKFSDADLQDFFQDRRHFATPGEAQSVLLLPDILENAAAAFGAQGGIIVRGAEFSYAAVNAMSDRLAHCLAASGVVPGDRVMALLGNSLEFVVSCFAVWKAGAILVPDDPAIKSESLGRILEDAAPSALILERNAAEALETAGLGLESVKVVLVKDRTFALSGLDQMNVESLDAVLESEVETGFNRKVGGQPGDIASITYTSGTTGCPKGVMHTHESWLAGALFTRDYNQLTKRDTIVIPLPLHHGLAFRQILAYVLAGARILLASDIYQALKLMRDHRPSAAVLVPAGVNILLDHFPGVLEQLSPSLRYLEIGSAPLAAERFNHLRQLMPSTLIHLPYGLTEARVGFLKAGADGLLNRVAKTAPNLELRIIDEHGAALPPGQTGEILLRGPGLMKGYWGQSEKDIAALKAEGFRTGDMGMIDERGDVALLGRRDDMLKVGGHKVNPAEVEAVLRRHAAVSECAVIGLADPNGVFETKLHAFIVPVSKGEAPGERELEAHCRNYLESFKVPAHFHFQHSLPKSSVGKILRQALRATTAELAAAKAA
jgi:excisionase family DNA binding protein